MLAASIPRPETSLIAARVFFDIAHLNSNPTPNDLMHNLPRSTIMSRLPNVGHLRSVLLA